MTINLTDPTNHPANDRLTDERITSLIAELRRSLEYQNGGDMAYVIADAIKGMEELLVSREAEPVMYCSQETIAASKDGEHLLRTLSTPSGDCAIPLYTTPPATVYLPFDEWLSQQTDSIDVDCGCVSTEAFMHWMRKAYEDGNAYPAAPQEVK